MTSERPNDPAPSRPDASPKKLVERLGAYADVDDEIAHHIAARAEVLMSKGWKPEQAYREAERQFGSVSRIRRQLAQQNASGRGLPRTSLLAVILNLKYAWRGIRTNLGFSATVVLTLGLGLGAASSVFVVLDASMLRTVPYRDADRLVELNRNGLTPAMADSWREASRSFADGWVAFTGTSIVRIDGPAAQSLWVVAVSPGADTLLGIPIMMGRGITPSDAVPGAPPVAVLSRGYFDQLGGDPTILGQTLDLETGLVTIVGVLRGGVKFPRFGPDPELWMPLRTDLTVADRQLRSVQGAWVRLRADVPLDAAQSRADVLAASLQARQPTERGWEVGLFPLTGNRQNSDVRRAMWLLTATVAAIFLISLVNGVNLLLVRTSARTRELAVRTAIGASRGQLLGQFLTEGLLLGVLGGVAAVGCAVAVMPLVRQILPTEVVFFSPHAFAVEGRSLMLAFAGSICAGLVFGCLPALHAVTRQHSLISLTGRTSDRTPTHRWVRTTLVVAQITLSMTLLAGAGLFLRSFAKLVNVDPGFDVERIALAQISLSPTQYPSAEDRAGFMGRLIEALEAHPLIDNVTRSNGTGLSFGQLEAEGRDPPNAQPDMIPNKSVALDYTEVMGIDLLDGRSFAPEDYDREVAIIDQDLAGFLWGSARAVGQRFRMGENGTWYTVVGVADELRLSGPGWGGRDQRSGPYQFLVPAARDRTGAFQEIAIRTSGRPRDVLPAVREVVRGLDPAQPVAQLRTAAAALAETEDKPRFLVSLSALLAVIAVTLAAIGLYGVLAFSVSQGSHEIGVRMALGAMRAQLRMRVVLEGLRITGLGILLGLLGTVATARFVEPLLYEVPPLDPPTLVGVALLFGAIATLACLIPAERATRVDPIVVLREE